MTLKKATLKSLIFSCFKAAETPSPEKGSSEKVSRPYSFRRVVSLSDISDLSSADDISSSFLGSNLHMFTYAELSLITHNFSFNNFIGQGGFGPVYKGFVDDKIRMGLKAQPVAVKALDLDGLQGHQEWLAEIFFLGQLRHRHLVKLIGYCCEEKNRLLVYEYMARGSLESQLFRRYSVPLPWSTRMKIALGAAKGLAFLHEGDKPVIFRDFKTSNILLDPDYTAKLSDFGLAKDGPEGEDTHVTTQVMGTQGYAAPEYIMTGRLTTMSDVYSFGVVLLELLTGKRSMDSSRSGRVQCLVEWARPYLKDPRKLSKLVDPKLECQYSISGAQKVAALASQCLSHYPKPRPNMVDVVKTLESLQGFDDVFSGPLVVYIAPEEKDSGVDNKEQNRRRHGGRSWRHSSKLPLSSVANSDSPLCYD